MVGVLESRAERRIEATIAGAEFDQIPGAGSPLRLARDAPAPQE